MLALLYTQIRFHPSLYFISPWLRCCFLISPQIASMVIFLPSPKWKSFSIHNNQTVKVKCWKRKWRWDFLKLAVKSIDCRTKYSNTKFWSPDKVKNWEPYQVSVLLKMWYTTELEGKSENRLSNSRNKICFAIGNYIYNHMWHIMFKRTLRFELLLSGYWQNVKFTGHCPQISHKNCNFKCIIRNR